MTQDLYYIEEGYYDTGYYVYTADAESAVAVSSTVDCSADKFKSFNAVLDAYSSQVTTAEVIMGGGVIEATASFGAFNSVIATVNKTASGTVNLNAAFTQTVTVSYIYGADLFAFGNAQLQSQVDRIRDTNTQANTYFDIATGYIRYRSTSADAADSFNLSSQEERIRASQVETQDAFFVSVTATRIQQSPANISSQSTLEVISSGTIPASASLETASSLQSSVGVIKIVECYADDYFTQQTTSGAIRDYSISLTVSASANAIAVKTTEVISQHNSQFNQNANANATFDPSLNLTTVSNVFAVLSGTRGVDIVVYGFASLTATANSAFQGRAVINSISTVVADNTRVKLFKTNLPYVDDNYTDPNYATEVPGVNSVGTLTANVETFVYVRGVGSLTSQTAQTTVANYNVTSTLANITAQATLASTPSRKQQAEADLGALFTPELTVDIFKNSFAVLDSVATVDAQVNKYNGGIATLTSQPTLSVIGGVEKPLTAGLTFLINFASEGSLVAGADAQLLTEATVTTELLRIQELASSITSTVDATATSTRIKPLASEINVAATLTAQASPIRDSIELLVSSGTIVADPTVIRSAVITTDAIFSEVVVATTQTIQPQINLYVTSTLTATPVATLDTITLTVSAGTLTANANIIKSTSANTTSQATVVASVKRIAKARATIQTSATLSCQAQKSTEIAIVVNGFANLTVIGQTARLAIVLTGSQATLDITARRIRDNPAAITARVTILANTSITKRFVVTTATQATLTAQIGAIHIEPYLTWIIPFEDRAQEIRQETNTYKIGKDNRIYSIGRDKREYTVKEETRIYTIRR